ncbi:MAG: universal stress protein [Sphingomonadales bacterium]
MTENTVFVVAVNESEGAGRAASFAAREARLHGATLLLLHVIEWSQYEFMPVRELESTHSRKKKAIETAQTRIIDPLTRSASDHDVRVEARIDLGDTNETVVTVMQEVAATRVYVGRHAGSHVLERFVGSLPSYLVRHATVPVTIVP